MSSNKRRYQIFALVSICIVVLLAAGEVLARLAGFAPYSEDPLRIKVDPPGTFFQPDETLGYRNKPGIFRLEQPGGISFSAQHDERGRRITGKDTVSGAVPEIWIFGCSITYGWAVNDSDSYPWRLQETLPSHRIRNFGTGGYGSFQNLLEFEHEIRKNELPETVVLAYAPFHDERNIMSDNYKSVLARSGSLGPLQLPYARIDSDGELIRHVAEPTVYHPWPFARISALFHGLQRSTSALWTRHLNGRAVTRSIFRTFKEICNAKDIAFVLAYIGQPSSAEDVKNICTAEGIEFMDISIDLKEKGASFLPHDPHPTPASHKRYARSLADHFN